MRHRSLAFLVLAGCLLAWPALPGRAQEGPQDREDYPDGSRWPGGELEKVEGRIPSDELEARLLADPGSRLASLVQSGVPAGLVLSRGVATRVMSELADAGEARAGAAGKWFVVYPFKHRGVRVCKHSDALAVVSAEGEVLYVSKRNVPASVDESEPTVPAKAAIAVARQKAREAFGPAQLKESPPELEIWVEPSLAGRLAWTLTIESTSRTDPKARRYWVAAVGQPRVLQAENLIYYGHSGTVSAKIWETSPFSPSPTSNHVLPEVELIRTPGKAAQVTGLDGRYSYPDGEENAKITAILAGPRCVVKNEAGAEMETSGSDVPTKPIDLTFSPLDDNSREMAQTTAFFWTNATYQFAQSILDPASAKLTVNVNKAGSCYAFFHGDELSINFYEAGCKCPNTAYADVIAHEYGHAVDNWHGSIKDMSYSEGFGDAMALLLTRQSCYGRDFFGVGTCFRDANSMDMWPPGISEVAHARGKRYAQFVWQLVQQLRKTLSEEKSFHLAQHLVLAAAAGNPSTIPKAVELSFIADDNDGDLGNGTPHCKALVAAAESRKLPFPSGCPL